MASTPPDNVLVSIIIPSYDRPNMLRQSLYSVINQTYENFEVIVVDDGSPEPLKSVVEQIEDDRIKYYRLSDNKGANVARNKGITRSSGEYMSFLDDDDRWEPTKLEKQVKILNTNPNVGLVYTGQRFVDEKDKTTKQKNPDARGDVKRYLLKGGYIGGFSCVMLRRELIRTAGKPDPELPILQDTEWWFRLSQETIFFPVEQPLVIRRIGDHGQIGDKYEELRDIAYPKVYNKHKDMADEEGIIYKSVFKSQFLRDIGAIALSKGRPKEARIYLLKSLLHNPLSISTALRFLVSLGGTRFYHQIRKIGNAVHPKRG